MTKKKEADHPHVNNETKHEKQIERIIDNELKQLEPAQCILELIDEQIDLGRSPIIRLSDEYTQKE